MRHSLEAYKAHPGRNPAHVPGVHNRKIMAPNPKRPGTVMIVGYGPRNPSRWLPHEGGANAPTRSANTVSAPVVTRQQRRAAERKAAKRAAK